MSDAYHVIHRNHFPLIKSEKVLAHEVVLFHGLETRHYLRNDQYTTLTHNGGGSGSLAIHFAGNGKQSPRVPVRKNGGGNLVRDGNRFECVMFWMGVAK
jgi:hypothetical protein